MVIGPNTVERRQWCGTAWRGVPELAAGAHAMAASARTNAGGRSL